jgi:hypothetical protein
LIYLFFCLNIRCRPQSIYKEANFDENSNLINESNFLMPIEINLRLGGAETWSMIKSAYNVDLIQEYLNICLGSDLYLDSLNKKALKPLNYCISKDFHPAKRALIKAIKLNIDRLETLEDVIELVIFRPPNDRLTHSDYMGWISVKNEYTHSYEKLQAMLNEVLACVKFEFVDY